MDDWRRTAMVNVSDDLTTDVVGVANDTPHRTFDVKLYSYRGSWPADTRIDDIRCETEKKGTQTVWSCACQGAFTLRPRTRTNSNEREFANQNIPTYKG